MKRVQFVALTLCCSLAMCCSLATLGCGGAADKETAKAIKSNNSKPNDSGDQTKKNEGGDKTLEGKKKPVKIDSKLPFKDLDVATADKGIDPGRILIDSKGKDSAGKSLALSDYKGKVILLDTWASW